MAVFPYSFDLAALAIFVFGLAFGSFLNVCIYRLPRGLSVVRPGSACPTCHAPVKPYDNIPVVSWLVLGGRCRNCRRRITPRYLVVELLVATLFVLCYLAFGPTLLTLKFCIFSFLLIGLTFTDAELQLLPDALTLPGLALGILFSLFLPVDGFVQSLLMQPFFSNLPLSSAMFWHLSFLLNALVGAAVGAGFVYFAGVIYERIRGVAGMGFGDVKLMAMVGAFLGVRLTLFTIFAASLAGSLVGLSAMLMVFPRRLRRYRARPDSTSRAWQSARILLRNFRVPFGVFLGSMALLALFYGDPILRWYGSFF